MGNNLVTVNAEPKEHKSINEALLAAVERSGWVKPDRPMSRLPKGGATVGDIITLNEERLEALWKLGNLRTEAARGAKNATLQAKLVRRINTITRMINAFDDAQRR